MAAEGPGYGDCRDWCPEYAIEGDLACGGCLDIDNEDDWDDEDEEEDEE